jgi:hypothetical protein
MTGDAHVEVVAGRPASASGSRDRLVDHAGALAYVLWQLLNGERLEHGHASREIEHLTRALIVMNVVIDIGPCEGDDERAVRVRIVKADRCVRAPAGMQRDQCVATLATPLLCDHHTVTEAA